MDSRRQASEAIKDLMVNEKRSRLPLVLGVLIMLLLLGGVGYWFYLPPDHRPALYQLKSRAIALARSVLNAPIGGSAPAAPATDTSKSSKTDSSSEDVHLLGN